MANEVSRNLEAFIKDLEPKYIKGAMENACATVQNAAITKVPKDTGALRRSIDFEVSATGDEGCVYSNLEYAPYVEIGTGIYSTKGGGRQTPWAYKGAHGWVTTRGNKPQPFLEPALMTSKSDVLDCFGGLF